MSLSEGEEDAKSSVLIDTALGSVRACSLPVDRTLHVLSPQIVTMPRVSGKRKTQVETARQKALKRWKREESEEPETRGGSTGEASTSAATTPATPDPHVSAASYRHSLLPPEESEVHQTSEDSALLVISLQRLQTIFNLVKCECGNGITAKVTSYLFDCTINLRCDKCDSVVHHSEPISDMLYILI